MEEKEEKTLFEMFKRFWLGLFSPIFRDRGLYIGDVEIN